MGTGTRKFSVVSTERIQQLRERQKDPEMYRPISTGLLDLNAILNGGFPRLDNFYVSIIGKEKRGKTTLGLQFFMTYCELSNQKGILYNLEENEYQAADRALAMRSTGPSRTDIFRLTLTEKDFEHFDLIANDISLYDTYINDSIYKLADIFKDAEAHNASIICIDNFQLLTDGKGRDQREQLVYLSKEIMRYRNKGNKIFLLAQGTEDGKSFGSIQVAMDADLCILIDNVFEYEGKKKILLPNLRKLRVTQSRFSPTGECDVIFDAAYSRVRTAVLKSKDPDEEEFATFEQLELNVPEENEDFDHESDE